MKKMVLAAVSICLVATAVLLCVFSSEKNVSVVPSEISKENNVITVADKEKNAPDAAKVLETRFINMLNHNFVYDDAFHSVEEVVNSSMPALLDLRESEDSSFIEESYVSDYVYNMYGIEITNFLDINSEFEKKEGYVYILPRGYEVYKHNIINVTENEDETYKVKTKISVASHDGVDSAYTCESLFVRNTASQFGFNIVYSNILSDSMAI